MHLSKIITYHLERGGMPIHDAVGIIKIITFFDNYFLKILS